MIDALLLELEGVVVDSEPLWRDALSRSLAEHRLAPAPGALECGRGMAIRERLNEIARASGFADDETALDLLVLAGTRRFAEALRRGITIAPGARELIASARQRARVAVVTRLRRADAEHVLSLAGLEMLVEFVVAAEDAAVKPSPASYEKALARLARRRPLARDAVLALEDGATGARAARAARVRCVVVGDGGAEHSDASVASLAGHDLPSLARLASAHAERAG